MADTATAPPAAAPAATTPAKAKKVRVQQISDKKLSYINISSKSIKKTQFIHLFLCNLQAKAPKVKKSPKAKGDKPKTASHPTYGSMIKQAIKNLKDRKGASKQAILKYIVQNYKLGENLAKINAHLRIALKRGVTDGSFKQSAGTGASGRFRLPEGAVAAKKVHKKKAASPKKSPAKKAKKPKVSKPKPKKSTASPKKSSTKAKKPKATKPKKAKAAKSPSKKAAKPKKTTTKKIGKKTAKTAAPAPAATA
ncbi:hypothetical protein WR25_05770 isoform B [Diploscapter pachys]|uniref:H15 domain-containing protein n=1 Tax=Diploscapter pachys TaxID=2018661 RepID=A0A2A2M0Y2_9BILA|nr:hypothetical protein WR25_05770 isoform B [Diploscapter pachys]